ncbi:hypothetical protein GUJ93_ZPchr0005g15246 [Zizania palustris]|uniref:Uncharacterized protein n=1 Tax=Zizania palustris TaxID=103762 RepID=A0A8J5W1L7_ZIZPA|nr:hypothetical protein GUJ93_ZPchr0005g15246 [Zizania palustris]
MSLSHMVVLAPDPGGDGGLNSEPNQEVCPMVVDVAAAPATMDAGWSLVGISALMGDADVMMTKDMEEVAVVVEVKVVVASGVAPVSDLLYSTKSGGMVSIEEFNGARGLDGEDSGERLEAEARVLQNETKGKPAPTRDAAIACEVGEEPSSSAEHAEADASDLALKHQKKDSHLVAYFGDNTFACYDESQLNPFVANYSQMEKQSGSHTFVSLVIFALQELSRQILSGMSCSCFLEELSDNGMSYTVENARLKDGVTCSVVNQFEILACFSEENILDFIKSLALFPGQGGDLMELVIVYSQLTSFY